MCTIESIYVYATHSSAPCDDVREPIHNEKAIHSKRVIKIACGER